MNPTDQMATGISDVPGNLTAAEQRALQVEQGALPPEQGQMSTLEPAEDK